MNRPAQHIEFLDHFRGLAIIAVFLFHLMGAVCGVSHLPWGAWFCSPTASKSYWLLFPFSFGWCGVAVFFVVSGFCIHLSHRRRPDWREFWLRRLFRLYPAYLFAVLLCGLAVPWTKVHFSAKGAIQLISHLTLVHNLDNRTFYGLNVAFWSIAVEVQLYLLYPLLLRAVSRWGWRQALMGTAVLECGLRLVGSGFLMSRGEMPYWFLGLPFLYWFSWSLGVAVAEAYLDSKPIPFASQSAWLWGGIAAGSMLVRPLASFSFMLFAITTAIVIGKLLGNARVPIKLPAVISRHLKLAGVWSFSIYLLHAPFLYGACAPALALALSQKLHLAFLPYSLVVLLVGLCLWPVILALSGLCYNLVELPGIAFGKRLIELQRSKTSRPELPALLNLTEASQTPSRKS